jgi:hypothetical protein
MFGAVAELEGRERTPAIYLPAGISNAGYSEVVLADPAADSLRRPAWLRLRADPKECVAIGNLIPADLTGVSKQLFYCKSRFIEIPLTVTNGE